MKSKKRWVIEVSNLKRDSNFCRNEGHDSSEYTIDCNSRRRTPIVRIHDVSYRARVRPSTDKLAFLEAIFWGDQGTYIEKNPQANKNTQMAETCTFFWYNHPSASILGGKRNTPRYVLFKRI